MGLDPLSTDSKDSKKIFENSGTGWRELSSYPRIVNICPPALAIQDMGPEASTPPPPGDASGPKNFLLQIFAPVPMTERTRPPIIEIGGESQSQERFHA